MQNGTEKYIETVAYLGKLYDFANAELFGGELVKPVITVQTDERNKTNGWWSLGKVWKENGEDDGEHELNMTAQQLHRPINEIAATLIHEMCHQYATVHEMKDTSRSGNYHNKLFKKIGKSLRRERSGRKRGDKTRYAGGRFRSRREIASFKKADVSAESAGTLSSVE